ncbi:hypothetical protein HPHPA8_1393 [Helicobacter pylori Hp A-8]|nr:hypothetical protein HPHPA8_1393 [Helicobacter pylori Hp A-8]
MINLYHFLKLFKIALPKARARRGGTALPICLQTLVLLP